MLYQVTAPYMCAGLEVDEDGVVVFAAPILKWTVGKRIGDVIRWVDRKGFEIQEVET